MKKSQKMMIKSPKQQGQIYLLPIQDEDNPQETEEFMMLPQQPKDDDLSDRGIIILDKEITVESLRKASNTLYKLHFDPNFKEEVQIILNSPGGVCSAGWAFIDLMDFVKMKIKTVAMGEIASMATMIFVAGDQRTMAPNSQAMIHNFHSVTWGTYDDLVANRKSEDMENQRILSHFMRCSKHKAEKDVKKHLLVGRDLWLTPNEMKTHGLADSVSKRRNKG